VRPGYSVETFTPSRVVGHRDHDPEGVGGGLRVLELAQDDHVALGLRDPVPPGDPDVEEPVGHVARDLLGTEDAHLVDAGIGDRRLVLHLGRPPDAEVGGVEQRERRPLERALGEHEFQHRGRG
jgi:hypothetical protein